MKYIQHIVLMFIILFSTVIAQNMSGVKICIDPGHGGHESDDRFISATGFWESESNLDKAYYLKDILEKLGATVILTRYGNDDDPPTEPSGVGTIDDPTLSQRAAIANDNHVDYMNSIHTNGWQGTSNSTLMLYRGYDTQPVFSVAKEMGNIMGKELFEAQRTTHYSNRGDWSFRPEWGTQGYGVLRPLAMPGTISEASFHDYIPESWRLQNLDYRKSEAWAIARSFVKLNDAGDFPTHNLAGIVRDSFEKVSHFSLNGTSDAYKPVNNITVTLNPGGKIYHGDANNNGYFLFDSLNAGDYEIIVAAEGYYPDTARVTIESSFYNFKDFRLFSKIPPIVVSTVPADGDTSFPAWDPIVIQFSRPMDTILTAAAISIYPEEPLEFTWLNDGLKLEIRSDSLDFLSEYTITITGIAQDIFGHQFDGDGDGIGGDTYSFFFKTGPEDMAAPRIIRMYPGLNATNIELFPVINLTFDEELDTNSILDGMVFMQNYPEYDTIPTFVQHFIVNHQSVFNVFPLQELEHNKLHKVRVIEGLRDLFGNEIERKKTITFRTGVERWIEKKIDDFESGLTSNWWSPGSSGSTTGITDPTLRSEEFEIVNHVSHSQVSMKIKYSWAPDSTEWLLREYLGGGSPRNITFNKNYIMQAYLFGDGSRTLFRFTVDDNNGHEVSPWYTIDWIGWKLVSWDMTNDSTGEWIGDGNLDGTLNFDSFQMTYNPDDPDARNIGTIYIDDLRLVTVEQLGINAEIAPVPLGFTLHQNYPNPFNPTTNISFSLSKPSNVRLEIFNIRGEKVRSLTNGYFNAGYWTAVWNGKNDNGLSAPSGMYMYRMIAGTGIQVKNMLLLK